MTSRKDLILLVQMSAENLSKSYLDDYQLLNTLTVMASEVDELRSIIEYEQEFGDPNVLGN
jgi:hypothetical protein|tara:strand:- start:102 stop:284 length:183 start_codon:yes stop_codon:yes gene_type:complete